MKYQDIVELKKRMEFRMTEPETLIELVRDAQNKGEKVRRDLERLRNIASELTILLEEKGFIFTESMLKDAQLKYEYAVGIDGSFQLVGGLGGKWYAPISVARVILEKDLISKPHVDIFWAHIEEIDSLEDYEPNIKASVMMLIGETKAILNWGTLNKGAYVFIDGPIVDPPVVSYGGKEYIKDRCEGIKRCIENSVAVGCVKRSRDIFYIENLKELFQKQPEKEHLDQFLNDQYLMLHVFSSLRSRGYQKSLFTKWLDISSSNPIYELYKNEGLYIVSLFFQKGTKSQILRLDIPFLEPPSENVDKVNNEVLHVIKAVDEWTYPGQDFPVPVFLAHNKCNIREGCAEVLYEEIMTRGRTTDPYNQAILTWMR